MILRTAGVPVIARSLALRTAHAFATGQSSKAACVAARIPVRVLGAVSGHFSCSMDSPERTNCLFLLETVKRNHSRKCFLTVTV